MKIIPFFMRKLESLDFGRLLQFQTIEIALHKKLPAVFFTPIAFYRKLSIEFSMEEM